MLDLKPLNHGFGSVIFYPDLLDPKIAIKLKIS